MYINHFNLISFLYFKHAYMLICITPIRYKGPYSCFHSELSINVVIQSRTKCSLQPKALCTRLLCLVLVEATVLLVSVLTSWFFPKKSVPFIS